MSEGPVAGAGTAPGGAPGAPATPSAPPTPPVAPSAPGTETAEDIAAQETLFDLINQQGGEEDQGQRTPEQEIAHWKEMARKNEQRAKANADKAQQFDAYQESQKTELQKAIDRANRAEEEAQAAKAERFRLAAASSYELPPEIAALLVGGTEEEINANAERFAKAINERAEALSSRNGNGQPQRQPGGRPVESLRPGAAPASQVSDPKDLNSVFRGVIGRNQ